MESNSKQRGSQSLPEAGVDTILAAQCRENTLPFLIVHRSGTSIVGKISLYLWRLFRRRCVCSPTRSSSFSSGAADPTLAQPSRLPRDVPTKLDISHAASLIKHWSDDCDRYHPHCNIAPNAQLPRRVLDVSSREDGTVKLKELSGTYAPYIALRLISPGLRLMKQTHT